MIATKRMVLGTCFGLSMMAPGAFAQGGQTIESAHGFLASVINKGATGDGYYRRPFTNYSGSGCQSQLKSHSLDSRGKPEDSYTIGIDWSAASEITAEDGRAQIRGAIARNGYVEQGVGFLADSKTMGDRMAKAFEFLRKECDKTGKYGF